MKITSIEDARRVFIATMKLIYQNDRDGFHTYALSRNRERINLPDNSGDIIVVPTQKFKKALGMVMDQVGLHPEMRTSYINAFVELHWIMRPKDKAHKYKKNLSNRYRFHGKETAVYCIDRIIFDFLSTMDGVVAKDISNNVVHVPERDSDGNLVMKNGSTTPTTVTTGVVSDARYNAVAQYLDERIKTKDGKAGL